MGKISKFAFSAFWRAMFIVPFVAALFLFILNQRIESEELHNIAIILAIALNVFIFIGAAGSAGDYAKSRRKFTAYLTSVLMSSVVGISGVLSFFLIIVVSAGQTQSIPSIFEDFSANSQFIIASSAVGIGVAWFFTIATWLENSAE